MQSIKQDKLIFSLKNEHWIEILIVPMVGEILILIMIDATKILVAELYSGVADPGWDWPDPDPNLTRKPE